MAKDAKEVKSITSKAKSKTPKKTESSYAVKLKHAMTLLKTDIALDQGIPAKRLTSKGVWKSRVITVSTDKQAFFITHEQIPDAFSSQLASTLPMPFFTLSKGFSWSNDSERYVRHLDIADIDAWQVGAIVVQKLETKVAPEDVPKLLTIFHHGFEVACFIVPDAGHLKHLVQAFRLMKKRYNLMTPWIDNQQLLLRYIYYDIDSDKSGSVNLKEFHSICKRINFTAPWDMDRKFETFTKGRKNIGIDLTNGLLNLITVGSKIMPAEKLWNELFGKKDTNAIGANKFLTKFLKGCQGETDATIEDAEKFIKSMKSLGGKGSKKITKSEFVHFLHSKYNGAYNPAALEESKEKLNLPLSKYWINTSHNTYLLGDQFKSKSSVEAYQNALKRGCKCLELDCWDGEVDKDTNEPTPIIKHGHTITVKMKFRDACLVTNSYLKTNPDSYPIILSLENHCSIPFQQVMAKNMVEIFGKKLFVPSEKQCSGANLPSPEELRGMVIIKGKRPPEPDDGAASTSDLEADYIDPLNPADDEAGSAEIKHKHNIDEKLRELTLLNGAKFKLFETSLKQEPTTMHSIGETKITKIVRKAEENAKFWRQYNEDHMTRTYPAGFRVDSTNYNPVLAWAMGCQLVALNFQTTDSFLSLNDGLFRQAGGCGYLQKPASLMGGPKPAKKKVKVSILSARCIPKPKGAKRGELIDPYVQTDLHDVRKSGATEEAVRDSFKTSTVDNNGFCPVWNDASGEFEIHCPDVAFIHFRIIDDDLGKDDKLASSAIPINHLRPGYRCVQLFDESNTRTGPFESSTLFVKIEFLV